MNSLIKFYSLQTKLKTNPVNICASAGEIRILLNDNDNAIVTYEKLDEDTYDLIHSYIPEKYQGQGLGIIFAERVFGHLVNNNKKFKLTCEFLHKVFMQNRAKYQHHVVGDE